MQIKNIKVKILKIPYIKYLFNFSYICLGTSGREFYYAPSITPQSHGTNNGSLVLSTVTHSHIDST
jgi:hypothetical protein